MTSKIVLIHGWSTDSSSMAELKAFLSVNGYEITDIWFSDYISMEDDVEIEDVAKMMNTILSDQGATLGAPFDLVVHSTGGLVAREWLTRFYPDGLNCPVKRIVMLAPANFGSKLAAMGKSYIGRVIKGWDNWLHTGQRVLEELELAAPYQWALAQRDLISPDGQEGPYGPGKVWPFVIVGSRGNTDGFGQLTNEDGSDSVVRPCAANLNAIGFTIDFTQAISDPEPMVWPSKVGWPSAGDVGPIPIAVLPDRNHGSIVHPATDTGTQTSGRLGELILQALACDSDAAYGAIAAEWSDQTEATAELAGDDASRQALFQGQNEPKGSALEQYMQLIIHVRDEYGRSVNDYFIEFFTPGIDGEQDSALFHQCVLKDVHTNTIDPSYRCLFLDRTALDSTYYKDGRTKVAMSISAATLGSNISYFSDENGAHGEVVIHDQALDQRRALKGRLYRNRTHLIDIIIPREAVPKVFQLNLDPPTS